MFLRIGSVLPRSNLCFKRNGEIAEVGLVRVVVCKLNRSVTYLPTYLGTDSATARDMTVPINEQENGVAP
jgi:hypothetical protein